jgi:hypothetical protein
VVQQGQRARHEDCGTDALHDPGSDERAERRCERAADGREGEDAETGHVDALGTDAIAECARTQDQRGKGKRVRRNDPLQRRDTHAEIGPDRSDRHVHHADVELHDAEAEACREQSKAGSGTHDHDARCGVVRSASKRSVLTVDS